MGGDNPLTVSTDIRKEDIAEISAFIFRMFPFRSVGEWAEHLLHIWDENPAFSDGQKRGVVMRSGDELVGFIAKFPTRMQLGDEEVLVANASNLSVHEGYRNMKIGSRLRQEYADISKGEIRFATTMSNKATQKINLKLGFVQMPTDMDPDRETDSLLIADPKKAVRLKPSLQDFVERHKIFLPAISWMIWLGNWYQTLRLKMMRPDEKGYAVHELERADASFDELWNDTKNMYYFTNVRTADVVNWHLSLGRDAKRKLYGCYDSGGRLIGYMLFADTVMRNAELHYCIDVWFRKDCECAIGFILNHVLQRADIDRYGAIVIPHFNKAVSDYLTSIGLIKVKGLEITNFYMADEAVRNRISAGNSYFVYIQGDRGVSENV